MDGLPQVPSSPQLAPVERAQGAGTKPAIGLDAVPARSRRVKRFGLAGTIAVVVAGGAASVPLFTSQHAPLPRLNAGASAPVVVPASELVSHAGLAAETQSAPAVTPVRNVDDVIQSSPAVAALPPQVTRHEPLSAIRPKHVPVPVTPPRDSQATAAEKYLRAKAAALQAREYWSHFAPPRGGPE